MGVNREEVWTCDLCGRDKVRGLHSPGKFGWVEMDIKSDHDTYSTKTVAVCKRCVTAIHDAHDKYIQEGGI